VWRAPRIHGELKMLGITVSKRTASRKAIEAVLKWKFKPGYMDGKPVTVAVTIEVNLCIN